MFSCYLCQFRLGYSSTVIKHLRIVHGLYDCRKLNVKCSFPLCFSYFKTFNGLRKHLIAHEQDALSNKNTITTQNCNDHINEHVTIIDSLSTLKTIEHNDDFCQEYENVNNNDTTDETQPIDVPTLCNIFFCQIATLNLPQTHFQIVYDSTLEMIENIFENCLYLCSTDINTTNFLTNARFIIKTEINKYCSAYRRNKIMNSKVIMPREICIGMRNDTVLHKESESRTEVNIPKTFQYIPLLETLKSLIHNNTDLLKFLTTKNNFPEGNIIGNGTYLEGNALFQQKKYFLKLQLYYDDFETVNPLGSKTTVHKMGGIYFTILNLPSAFNTCLKNIHLLALFFTSDLKTADMQENISINKVLAPIIEDIKILETCGIVVEGFSEPIFGTIISLSHDNLAANSLHGMVESFQANYFCRMCLVHKNDMQNLFSEDNCILRNSLLYEEHSRAAENSAQHVFGIKFRSILNDLQFFKLCDSISVDIMHDILEGIIPYELNLFIDELLKLKLISLPHLNERLHLYDFGSINRSNKPSPIVLNKNSVSIKQRASQAWCLMRYILLIIDDIIKNPILERKHKILLHLLKIMSIVFAPRISYSMINDLQNLITEHLQLFKSEFGKLIPKQHFLIHYPTAIKKMGPLIELWSMRYEGKHAVFKYMVTKYKNFKNIAKTLAIHHQQMSNILLTNSALQLNIEYGPARASSLGSYLFKQLITENFPEFSESIQLFTYNWAKQGYLYKRKMFVCSGYNASLNLPQFSEIVDIVAFSVSEFQNHLFLVTKRWATSCFLEKLHSYKLQTVKNDATYELLDLYFLLYKEPYSLNQSISSTDWVLVPKYKFIF